MRIYNMRIICAGLEKLGKLDSGKRVTGNFGNRGVSIEFGVYRQPDPWSKGQVTFADRERPMETSSVFLFAPVEVPP